MLSDAKSLDDDEEVLVLDTAASPAGDGSGWEVDLHAWVYEPEEDSVERRLVLQGLKKTVGISPQDPDEEALFAARARLFLVDNERGERVTLRLAGNEVELPPTAADGHTRVTVRLELPAASPAAAAGASPTSPASPRWLPTAVLLPPGDPRSFTGGVQLVPARGISVLSDIDDTVKVTGVTDKRELLANTFLRPFRAVPGMAAAYARWAAQGAAFHYLSSSPWQLYHALSAFLRDAGFPRGALQLRHFRVPDGSFWGLLASPETYKIPAIDKTLRQHPARGFFLVGDSGEKDPEIYGEIARRYPAQVCHVFIRLVTPGPGDEARFAAAFAGVPPERITLFTDPAVLERVPAVTPDAPTPPGEGDR